MTNKEKELAIKKIQKDLEENYCKKASEELFAIVIKENYEKLEQYLSAAKDVEYTIDDSEKYRSVYFSIEKDDLKIWVDSKHGKIIANKGYGDAQYSIFSEVVEAINNVFEKRYLAK